MALHFCILITDAFGTSGGIAAYVRDFLNACSSHEQIDKVDVIARSAAEPDRPLSPKLHYYSSVSRSIVRFAFRVLACIWSKSPYSCVVCMHIRLLPFALLVARWRGVPLALCIYGIDAWTPVRRIWVRFLRNTDHVISISSFTAERFFSWAPVRSKPRLTIIPPAVALAVYTPASSKPESKARMGLSETTILLTIARLAAAERYKGIDEVLECISRVQEVVPRLRYIIVGDGDDRLRLEAKVEALGIESSVQFVGALSESDKLQYLGIADCFVMPSSGEGFGIVYLEALACGVPVVAGTSDAAKEALLQGAWARLVDPRDSSALYQAIMSCLRDPQVPSRSELEYYSAEAMSNRVGKWISLLVE